MQQLRTIHLFAGAGGGILADILLGHQPICAVEADTYCQQVLHARQEDNTLPWFPIFNNVKTFDGTKWRGIADIVCGGFPCQDISAAGKGAGIDGERSGLWSEFARIIGEVRPRYAFIENSPLLTKRGITTVMSDLAKMGYDAEWGCLSAAQVGAPHKRERIWILATDTSQQRRDKRGGGIQGGYILLDERRETPQSEQERNRWFSRAGALGADVADTLRTGWQGSEGQQQATGQLGLCSGERADEIKDFRATASNWAAEPELGRVANGVANRVHRLRSIGNGQVPQCAALAFEELLHRSVVHR